jgi:hypothetical protein
MTMAQKLQESEMRKPNQKLNKTDERMAMHEIYLSVNAPLTVIYKSPNGLLQ